MSVAKSKLNVRLLRRVKKHILEEPRRFVMWSWMLTKSRFGSTYPADGYGHVHQVKFASCGTAACVAGWTCLLGGKSKTQDFGALLPVVFWE